MSELLDPAALLEQIPCLTPDGKITSPYEALSVLVHAVFHRLGFRLVGLGEDGDLPVANPWGGSEQAIVDGADGKGTLPEGWNKNGPDHYAFRYKHEQSSLEYLVKVIRMGNKALVHATNLQDNKTATAEVPIPDYFSSSYFTHPSPLSRDGRPEPLVNGFISSTRMRDLIRLLQYHVIQKLVPGLRKEGYQETSGEGVAGAGEGGGAGTAAGGSGGASSGRGGGAGPSGGFVPAVGQPPSGRPPFFDDPDDPTMPRLPDLGRSPWSVGHDDLNPLPRPGMGGPGGFAPPPLFPGRGDTGGGMFVGPEHPMFRDRFQNPNLGPAGGVGGPSGPGRGGGGAMTGPWGGDGFLPPRGAPPGARFDPVGPWTSGPGGVQGQGGRGGGGPPDQGRGDPDFDELLPPGPEGPEPGVGGPLGGPGGAGRGRGGFGGGGGGGGGGGFGGYGDMFM